MLSSWPLNRLHIVDLIHTLEYGGYARGMTRNYEMKTHKHPSNESENFLTHFLKKYYDNNIVNAYKANKHVSSLKIRSYVSLVSNLNSHITAAATN